MGRPDPHPGRRITALAFIGLLLIAQIAVASPDTQVAIDMGVVVAQPLPGSIFFRCPTRRALPSGRPSGFEGRTDLPDTITRCTLAANASDDLSLPVLWWNI